MFHTASLFKKSTLALCICLFFGKIYAQVGPPSAGAGINNGFSFSSVAGTYVPLTGGTVFQSGTALNTNAVTNAVPLGFTFPYNGREYTEVYIHNNGFLSLGGDRPLPATYKAIAVYSPFTHGIIAPFASNLQASAVAGSNPEIRYGTSSGEFVVQWQDVYEAGNTLSGQINFQARLLPSGVIKFVYGPMNIPVNGAVDCQAGIRGADVYDAFNLDPQNGHTWADPNPAGHPFNSFGVANGINPRIPAEGLTWTFAPGKAPTLSRYAPMPYYQNFDSDWHPYLGVPNAVPDSAYWRSWPMRGNNSWRRNDVPAVNYDRNSGWSDADRGVVSVANPAGGNVARFHSSLVLPTTPRLGHGYLDLRVDLSDPGSEVVRWDWSNTAGSDSLLVWFSTDAGVSFNRIFGGVLTGSGWKAEQVTLQTDSPTCVIRFMGLSDLGPNVGTNDIGLDNVAVESLTGTKAAFRSTPLVLIPNPARDAVQLQVLHGKSAKVTVYDEAGRSVLAKHISAAERTLTIKHLAPGVYTVSVQMQNELRTGRLVILD